MFTNNYDILRKIALLGFSTDSGHFSETVTMKCANGWNIGKGTNYKIIPVYPYSSIICNMLTTVCDENVGMGYTDNWLKTKLGVVFGSGGTAATKEDYKLESYITSGLSITNESGVLRKQVHSNGSVVFTRSYILTNTSAADITVREVGLLVGVYDGTYHDPALVERTVLASPVTISPGGEALVTYSITVPDFQW